MAPLTSSLLLNPPLPRPAIELGRFVRDPLYPDYDFHQPESPTIRVDDTRQNVAVGAAAEDPAAVTHCFENVRETLDAFRGTRLEFTLLSIFSVSWNAGDRASSTTVTAPLCVIRQLRNPEGYFRAACRDESVRDWLEEQARRRRPRVYVVCGFKTFTDAHVEQTTHGQAGIGASVSVPRSVIGAGVVIPDLDKGVRSAVVEVTTRSSERSGERSGYTAPGELVYAVQYRRVRFSWFSAVNIDSAYLNKETRWKSYIAGRGGDSEDELDGIDAELSEAPGLGDLKGPFEQFDMDEERILVRIDNGNQSG